MSVAVIEETRKLTMHEELLMTSIKRQVGTFPKAILEGIMNAIEAGSPKVEVTLKIDSNDNAIINIVDTGIGIETEEDIVQHFEKFGTPHETNENTYWKQFRMGRGQMFAFGKNTWRTTTFQMIVDIDNEGLTYKLQKNLPYVQGCNIKIELYRNPIGYSHNSIDSFKDSIFEQIRFIETPVIFNGEQINTPASKCNWEFEDDNAYYMFNVGTEFKVYNLGAFVMNASMYDIGMSGIVVSKKQLKVNQARNDVQHDCKIYNGYDEKGKHIVGIKDIVKQNRIKNTRKARRSLNSWERISALKDLRDGTQEYNDIKNLALIPTAQGKHVSLESIRKIKQQWCFSPRGDRFADRLIEKGQALCFSDSILSDLGYTGFSMDFFSWLIDKYENNEWKNIAILYCQFEKLKTGISDKYFIIPHNKYTTSERRIITVLQNFSCWNDRRILLGSSDTANGWTDGYSYIAIDRKWLRRKSVTCSHHIADIMMLLSHEMAHNNDSMGSHVHGPEFYENQVEYMEGHLSPIGYCAFFAEKMKSARIDEKRDKENEKIKKQEQKLKKKLGIAVSYK